jgi:hypothetical protein
LQVESRAEQTEIDVARSSLEEAGLVVEPETWRIARASGLEVVSLVVVVVGATSYFKAFFARLGELHAEAANEVFQRLVRTLWESRKNQATPELRSEGDRFSIRLDRDLPDEAMTELLAGDFPDQARSGILVFDRKTGQWRDSREVASDEPSD